MKVPLTTFTALTAVLAFTGAASAGMNLPVMNQPNITAPPPPMILPHIVRPDIMPGIDTSRLVKQKARSSKKKNTKAAISRPTTKTTRVRTDKAGRDERVRSKLVRSKPLITNPPLPRLRPNFAERLRGLGDHLMLAQELARLGDLRERFGHNNAIDDASLGGSGGSGGSGFAWQDLIPESENPDAPQNDQIWRPEGRGATAYNPGMEQTGGFTRPQFGRRDASDRPGMSRTAGSARAGAGLRFGGGGETSSSSDSGTPPPQARQVSHDGGSGETSNTKEWTETEADGSTTEVRETLHEDGIYEREQETSDGDGNWVRSVSIIRTPRGNTRIRYKDRDFNSGTVDFNRRGQEIGRRERGPDSQPVPEDSGSGESMPCPKGSRGCGEPADEVPWQDKVAQPGGGEGGGEGVRHADADGKSVAERRNVVINPVDPENHIRTGGGRGPRPIEHVTGPGGDDPDTPPGR
jgi:hypothetical protein